jgi:hypothetical protein
MLSSPQTVRSADRKIPAPGVPMTIQRLLRVSLSFLAVSLLAWAWCPQRASAVSSATSFREVNPEELKMTSEPAAPGAPAIILFREVYRDDSGHTAHEDDYYRIKILTEEGRKYGDIEIPFYTGEGSITHIRARTIKPDGSIVNFDGKVFTKSIVKARGLKYLAKTFTLPAVQPGCVIEYYYTIDLSEEFIIASHWIVSDELFTRAAKFSLKPYTSTYLSYGLRWTWQNMPSSAPQPISGPDHIVRLEVANVPAFQREDMMPPEDEVKARVDFSYSLDAPDPDVNHFWSSVGKRLNGNLESFIGKRKAMEQAVSEIVGLNDPPEVKLQKIYARVQQLRNTSYEVRKTEEEEKRAKEKAPANAEEVWKRGYANGRQLTWLYLALVRAAGFEAYGVWVADREHYFFKPSLMQSGRLSSNLVLIKLNGKNVFCDPGAAFTPFGLLPWMETGIAGLQLDKKESAWIKTLVPTAAQARTERRANLTLSDTGDLEGKLTVTYTDLKAASLRLEERHADDTERKSYLEGSVKVSIPAASEVKLTNQPEWKNSALPLVAEFSIKVPGWASGAGRHVIVPVGLFSAREKHLFDHAERVYSIYNVYPYSESDDINIQIPAGWQVSSLPPGWSDTGKVVAYTLKAENDKGKLHLTRTLAVDFILMEVKYYTPLRNYFQEIKTTDDQQIVLDPGATRAGN